MRPRDRERDCYSLCVGHQAGGPKGLQACLLPCRTGSTSPVGAQRGATSRVNLHHTGAPAFIETRSAGALLHSPTPPFMSLFLGAEATILGEVRLSTIPHAVVLCRLVGVHQFDALDGRECQGGGQAAGGPAAAVVLQRKLQDGRGGWVGRRSKYGRMCEVLCKRWKGV